MSFFKKAPFGGALMNDRQERMFRAHRLDELLLRSPRRLVRPYAWVGHLPFAWSLVRMLRPRVLVELGTHTGNSFCGFCEIVVEDGLPTKCYAVDTWQGDPQAGFYDDTVYEDLAPYVARHYGKFAKLMRMTFDEAAKEFADGSIDLLHIDGLHTYEAVRHDFETWRRKLSPRAIVLFHDIRVFDRDFGVHRLWDELWREHQGFAFLHSHGLGVLALGRSRSRALRRWFRVAADDPEGMRKIYERASLMGLPADAFEYQRSVGGDSFRDIVSLDCELFLDTGEGFNETEKLIASIAIDEGKGTLTCRMNRVPRPLRRLRFDPGHRAIAVREVRARVSDATGCWHALETIGDNSFDVEQEAKLFPDDPWIEFEVPFIDQGLETLEIAVDIAATGSRLTSLLAHGYRRLAAEREAAGAISAKADGGLAAEKENLFPEA